MSCYIPFEIQTKIIKHVLPVKSLIRFKSVCKQWKSLINSSEFITHHTLNNTHQHHLLLRYSVSSEEKYVSVVDDDHALPQHTFSHIIVPPKTSTTELRVLDCSHGLVCLCELPLELKEPIVVWNPSIRKTVGIVPPSGTTVDVVGFGVCPKTSDPKIVLITHDMHAQVFTLSTRAWRSVPMNLSDTSSRFFYFNNQVVIDGVIRCNVYEMNEDSLQRIIAFDLTSEEFAEVAFPDSLASLVGDGHAEISRFKESLAVIDYYNNDEGERICDVWAVLKNGVPKSSFTKLFTVTVTDMSYFHVIGFRKNGQPVINLNVSLEQELQVYNPDLDNMNGLGIYGSFFDMVNYTESLLLLNHSDFIIQR